MTDQGRGFDTFTEGVIASWGTPDFGFDDLVAGITALYEARLEFPAAWPQHRQYAFVTAHANAAATELAALLDGLTDTVIERYGRENYRLPDAQTLSELIRAERSAALDDVELSASHDLPDEVVRAAAADPGRGVASMTACGPGQRPPTTTVHFQRRRGRGRP